MNNLTKLARRQLTVHEALRRLGFSADDIYSRFANGGGHGATEIFDVYTELKVGELTFNINYRGEKKVTKAAYAEVYKREVAWWNAPANENEKLSIYLHEFPAPVLTSLANALKAKGFAVPASEENHGRI